jgi:hypothetical protein
MIIAATWLVTASLSGLPLPSQDPVTQSLPIVDTVVSVQSDLEGLSKRPAILPVLYSAYGALQGLDVYTTHRALRAGAAEANPVVGHVAPRPVLFAAMKAVTAVVTVYSVERLWRRHRIGAVILMTAVNGATSWAVARNARVAGRQP